MKIDFPISFQKYGVSAQREPLIKGFVWATIHALPEGTEPDAVCAAVAVAINTFDGTPRAPAFTDNADAYWQGKTLFVTN